MKLVNNKSAQDIQDEIFRKMSAGEKLKLASDFSIFLSKLNKLGKPDGFSGAYHKDFKDPGKS